MKKLIILILLPYFAIAQNQPIEMLSNNAGFSVGINGNFMGWSSDYFSVLDKQEPNGIGLGLEVGYGITQRLELIGILDFNKLNLKQNDWDYFNFNNLALMARFNFGSTTKRLRPYVEVGLGRQAISVSPLFLNNQSFDMELNGLGIAYGGGLNYFIKRDLLVTLNVVGTAGTLDNFRFGNDQLTDSPDVSNFRVRVGVKKYIFFH